MNKFLKYKEISIGVLMLFLSVNFLMGSSHREAPLIADDPLADNVDLYAFRSPDNPDMITLIATYVPFQIPHGGPNYYNFGENIRYEIHVDNDAAVPGDEIIYRFTFNIENEDPTTFFNIRLGKQNQKATYTLERSMDGGQTFSAIVTDGIVPPNNIGERSITGGAGLNTTYDALFQGGVTTASTGENVYAGPTDDPFFVDLAGIFDLGDAPRQNGMPVDGVACMNVSALAIQVPISTLLKTGAPSTPTNILDSDYVIGVWASSSRPSITTLSKDNEPEVSGDWVQVSRLGMPLTNEAVIAIGDKDYWNNLSPYDEIGETTLDEYFYNPELALYMDDSQFGGAVPALSALRIQSNSLGAFDFRNGADGLYALKGTAAVAGTALDDAVFGTLLLPAPGKPRSVDLWPAFHTGVPNVRPYQLATGKNGDPLAEGKPFVNNFLPNGGDMLRLNMAVPPTPRDDANFSSLGLIQAAAIGLTVAPFNTTSDLEFIPNMDGFPNGRRLEDDVTRIELQAVSGVVLAAIGLWYDDYDPNSSPSPVTQDLLDVLTYTTGIESNDKDFTSSFPYLAQPFSGTGDCSGEIIRPDETPLADADTKVFVSSNNSGIIGLYNYDDTGATSASTFSSVASDADGVYYDETLDVLYQLNRSDNVVNAYSNVISNLTAGAEPTLTATSSSDFSNGREIAVSGNSLVVAQDAATGNGDVNQFVVYNSSPTSITLDKVLTTSINLWGITFDDDALIAIVDNSSNVAVFNNFLANPAGNVTPDLTVSIENIVRTHGLTYDAINDIMVLTDVGSGAVADDGAIVYIAGWKSAIADANVTASEQVRIAGPNSLLGNPVDVAYDHATAQIFVAERANAGGRFLTFDVPTANGDTSPKSNEFFGGASAIYLSDCREMVDPDPQSIVYFDLNSCRSFMSDQSNFDYSEFQPAYPNTLDCSTVVSTQFFRENPQTNAHSCTPGVNGSVAMCISSSSDCNYLPNDTKAIAFEVTLNPINGQNSAITGLSFYEKSPETYDWIQGASGPNNRPTLYGLRVLKNGSEIFRSDNNVATTDWTLEEFNFDDEEFSTDVVANYRFEFLGYCPIGNSANVSAWDLDEINLFGNCPSSNMVDIIGTTKTMFGEALEDIKITNRSIHPEYPKIVRSDADGNFEFLDNPSNFAYSITAEKDDEAINGVTTLDLVLIQRHILGLAELDSPYKLLAADADFSNSITAIDLIEIRKVILGLKSEFGNNQNWSFADSKRVNDILTADNPIDLINMSSVEEFVDLVGVKIGDVTNSARVNLNSEEIYKRSGEKLNLLIDSKSFEAGEKFEVEITSDNFIDLLGFQVAFSFDGLQLNNINGNGINLNAGNYSFDDNDNLRFSWNNSNETSFDESDVLMTLTFTALENGEISNTLKINEENLTAEVVDVNLGTKAIALQTRSTNLSGVGNKLYQNVPNPFVGSTDINFDLEQDNSVTLSIFSVSGKLLKKYTTEGKKGKNKFTLNINDLDAKSGILLYRLETKDFVDSKIMTVIN